MQMRLIRQRRNNYALILAGSLLLTLWFSIRLLVVEAVFFAIFSVICLVLLAGQNRKLSKANLIWDNRILSVPSATLYTADGIEETCQEETIVSTFGLFCAGRIYEWNCAGLRGIRLTAAEVEPAKLSLIFGRSSETMRVELLHGLTEKEEVVDVQEKLWHETGVRAVLKGW